MHDYVPRILTSSLRPLRSSRPSWPSSLPCRSDSFLNATIIITNIINMTPICRLLGGWSALFPTEIRSWQQPGEGGSATPTGAEPQIAGNLRSRLTRSRTRIHPGDHCFPHRKGLRPALSSTQRGGWLFRTQRERRRTQRNWPCTSNKPLAAKDTALPRTPGAAQPLA